MSLNFTKRTYVDGETVITADNLNDMQDALLDLDEDKSVYMPHEITTGKCTITISGTANGVIATTDHISIDIHDNILTSGEESTEITESLYEQLVDKVNNYRPDFATVSETRSYLGI